jgi:hypothetical protein
MDRSNEIRPGDAQSGSDPISPAPPDAYRPFQTGGRFCVNAVTPSWKSSLP